jgi:hypothetical protein
VGLTCALYRATGAELERIIEDPATLDSFIEGVEGPPLPVRTVRMKGLLGLVLRLFPITITEVDSSAANSAQARMPDPDRTVDIEKGWHGLHFLFTGTDDTGEEPACYLVRGGEDLDDEGQARALRPQQVRGFADYLSALTPAELERRYDPARMTALKIYPEIWKRPAVSGDDPLHWLLQCFAEVQTFMNRAAAEGDGVIVHIA